MLSGSVPAADPNSFATGALDIYRYGWFKEDNQWLIRLWPPGFMVLEGLVLKCFGVEAPFILILIVLNSIFLGFLLLVFRAHLLRVVPVKAASMLPLLPLFLPVTRFFLLQPGGIILGEAFSIVFFLTAMFLIPLAIRNRSWGEAIPAGLLLALSAYFRSNFELPVTFLTLMAALLVLPYYLLFRNWIRRVDRDIMSCFIRTVVIVLSVANAAMVPWRIHNYYRSGNFSWTQTPNIEYRNAGLTDEQLTDNNGFFVVRGGGNLAGNTANYCGRSDNWEFYQAFLRHFDEWCKYKFRIFGKFWFSSLEVYGGPRHDASFLGLAGNVASLLCVLLTWPLLWLNKT